MFPTAPRHTMWKRAGIMLAAIAAIVNGSPVARSDTAWEHEPYKVLVVVAADTTPAMPGPLLDHLVEDLQAKSQAYRAAVWHVDVTAADRARSRKLARRAAELAPDDVGELQKGHDKVLLLAVSSLPDGLRLVARDFDVRTQRWSSAVTRRVRQRLLLRSLAFRLLAEAFAPLAQVESREGSRVHLRMRASALARATGTPTGVADDTFFVPILRVNNREGQPIPGGIQTVAWTYLRVTQPDAQPVVCQVISGLNQPIRKRARGRVEQLALKVTPRAAPTRLKLRSRSNTETPLIGYELYCKIGEHESMQRIGQTDAAGEILISPATRPLRIVYVKHGNRMLARLPLLNGHASELVAYLPDNTPLLKTEGFISRLQEALTDVVARRKILSIRARKQMEADDFESAQETLDALQTLDTQSEFLQRIAQHQQETSSNDRRIQAQIDRLYTRTEKIITSYLDARSINMLQTEFDRAVAASRSGN